MTWKSDLRSNNETGTLSLEPLQHALGLAQPQVEGWKETEERKQEEIRKKAHEAAIKK